MHSFWRSIRLERWQSPYRLQKWPWTMVGESWYHTGLEKPKIPSSPIWLLDWAPARLRLEHHVDLKDWPSTTSCWESNRIWIATASMLENTLEIRANSSTDSIGKHVLSPTSANRRSPQASPPHQSLDFYPSLFHRFRIQYHYHKIFVGCS